MHDLSRFLLLLHRAAREVPFEDFQEHALTLLKRIVPFDAARWGTARHDARGAEFHAPYLYNDSPETLSDYETFREHDGAGRWCLAHLDTVGNFELHALYAGYPYPGLLNYIRRYRHMHALIIGCRSGDDGLHQAISLYGAYEDKPFDESHRQFLQTVFPHLTEALHTSLILKMERLRPCRCDAIWSLAICDASGDYCFVEPSFREMLRQEWPDLTHCTLPAPLAAVSDSRAPSHLQGRAVIFFLDVVKDVVFIRARARMPVDALSRRELEIAGLAAAGLTHKEIAKSLMLSPATVRNHLQAIHDRAGVRNNTELIEQLKRAGF
ncbi:helix-turn-helix transcriptional regulator [Paraburkholderia sp. J63]|uniref:helix-turn-helix transcriptional regulator n=1 Tax=Paraburkholderia sp. J63 TaxID=2805434 RepID=UPI002ABD38D1|nr:helix-turn-helix transcriptional regulator [Paraburkholderia sp. J63]